MEDENRLKRTFIAEPPLDQSVSLINILVRQIELGNESRQDVIDACDFILKRYKGKE